MTLECSVWRYVLFIFWLAIHYSVINFLTKLHVLVVSVSAYVEQSVDHAVFNFREICLEKHLLWIALIVLCRQYSVAILFSALLSSLYSSGGSRWWCCEGCDCWELLNVPRVLLSWFIIFIIIIIITFLLLLLLLLFFFFISFMQGIYTYIPEKNYVPREYSVTAILLLLFMVLISLVSVLNLLYFYISTFRSMCTVPNMAVFCSSFTSCFPGMLLTYFLNDFEIDPVSPIITGITFVFTLHMRCISIVRSLYFRIFSAFF